MIKDDYVLFQTSQPAAFHRAVLDTMESVQMDEGAVHEDVPDEIVADPSVISAVQSLLGPNAVPDVCRHVHLNYGSVPGEWHVDDYCGEPWPEGSFAILCYFPQDTPPEMGPTAVRVDGHEILGSGPAGTCLLLRSTVEHRATGNTTGKQRYMLKYLFRAGAK